LPTLRFPYRIGHSDLLGRIRRAILTISIFSERFHEWIEMENLLADTGEDLTLLPSHLGELLVPDIRDAKRGVVSGIVPGRGLRVYRHRLTLRIGPRSLRGTVGIADSTAVPALLGRHQALDHFTAVYRRGKALVLEW
jgi:hypothetical protein